VNGVRGFSKYDRYASSRGAMFLNSELTVSA
jgi:hypothetical protein